MLKSNPVKQYRVRYYGKIITEVNISHINERMAHLYGMTAEEMKIFIED